MFNIEDYQEAYNIAEFLEFKDRVKDVSPVKDSFGKDVGDSSRYDLFRETVFKLVNPLETCEYRHDKLETRVNCHKNEEFITLIGDEIILIKFGDGRVTKKDITANPNLGCYWDYEGIWWAGASCESCVDKDIAVCAHYETGNALTWGDDWELTCKDDPCAVEEGPCVYDPGKGAGNVQDCCPSGQLVC